MFKVGDRVICIKERVGYLEEGKEYTVTKLHEDTLEVAEVGGFHSFTRFCLVELEEKVDKKEIVPLYAVNVKNTSLVKGGKYIPSEVKDGKALINGRWVSLSRFSEIWDIPQWEILLKELNKRVGDDPGICSYAMSDKDGRIVRWQVKDICHARLRQSEIAVLDIQGHYKKHKDKQEYKAWIDYVINRSPYKDAFIKRDVEDVINSGIALDTEQGANLCVSGAIALRIGSEHGDFAKDFHSLVEAGFSESVAFVTSYCFNNYYARGDYVRYEHGAHNVISTTLDIECFNLLFKNGIDKGKPFKNTYGYVILEAIPKHKKETQSLYAYLSKHPMATERKANWGNKEKTVSRHPTYGLIPYAVYISKVIE